MSKRKAEPAPGSKVTGKQRMDSTLEQDLDPGDGLDILLGGAEGNESDLLPNPEDVEGSDDDALAEALGSEFDDVLPSAATGVDAIAFDETVGEMPDGLSDEQVEQPEEVDLSTYELTLPQARRVAESLARNGGLSSVRFSDHTLSVGDLKEEDELEWDSEEYTDVDAIVIAALLKANTTVKRLDLARNQIGDAGAVALANLLRDNSCIEYLNLESNMFGEAAGSAFRTAVGVNSTLQYLNLKENSVPTNLKDQIRDTWGASRLNSGVGLHL